MKELNYQQLKRVIDLLQSDLNSSQAVLQLEKRKKDVEKDVEFHSSKKSYSKKLSEEKRSDSIQGWNMYHSKQLQEIQIAKEKFRMYAKISLNGKYLSFYVTKFDSYVNNQQMINHYKDLNSIILDNKRYVFEKRLQFIREEESSESFYKEIFGHITKNLLIISLINDEIQ